ncbi:methionine adenosyltransferase [Candidatus Marinamargulisbacteria bacterium SCGC AG-343-K17]|nr:methionine adenosyltransferase [Candidatus Marinamargulisbacteria bacterium SCGC AG-343-K17]
MFLFTSESVSEGHPDKLCDQLSDTLLDAFFEQDPTSRVAIECFVTTGLVVVGGEVTTTAQVDVQEIIRKKLENIGYTHPDIGLDAKSCAVLVVLNRQSPDIAQGVNENDGAFKEQGAGDQGLTFGYACDQTEALMPLPIMLSHQLVFELAQLRKKNVLTYLRPDSKAQVTVEYNEDREPVRVSAIVVSTQHHPSATHEQIQDDIKKHLIDKVIPKELLPEPPTIYINPTGRFVVGGPQGDAGLTGRKIVVDTYGGWVPHGGGAFSGKDPSKIDRSAAYMARYVAKNCVAAGLCKEMEVQIAYAIGVAEPVSIKVNTFGTSDLSNNDLLAIIKDSFGFKPKEIIETLNLLQPIYSKTAAYGHFGRSDVEFPWEALNKVQQLKECKQRILTNA